MGYRFRASFRQAFRQNRLIGGYIAPSLSNPCAVISGVDFQGMIVSAHGLRRFTLLHESFAIVHQVHIRSEFCFYIRVNLAQIFEIQSFIIRSDRFKNRVRAAQRIRQRAGAFVVNRQVERAGIVFLDQPVEPAC